MVMHARKLPRLNDGYFERTQAHPFENTGKYSKVNSDKSSEKVRESPIGSNSDNSGRADSLDTRSSPRYHRTCPQRLKEKEHHDDTSSKSPVIKGENKNSGSIVPSNKELQKLSCSSDGAEGSSFSYQSNHDRSSIEESERRLQVGDWSEHISSSGKKYYYNCKTEISQWEKPKELIEWERQQALCRLSYESSRSKDRMYDRQFGSSGSKTDKHSNDTGDKTIHHLLKTHGRNTDQALRSSNENISNSAIQHKEDHLLNELYSSNEKSNKQLETKKYCEDSQAQDMDISPESCETYSSHADSGSQSRTQTPVSSYLPIQQTLIPHSSQAQTHLLSPSQVTLSNLPKLISQLAGTKGLPNLSELSPQEALRTIQQALQLTKQVTNLSQTAPDTNVQKSSSPAQSQSQVHSANHHTVLVQCNNNQNNTPSLCQLNANSSALSSYQVQHQQITDGKLDSDRGQISPGSDCSTHSSRHGSPTSSVSSLHSLNGTGTSSLVTAVLKPSIPSLTPSLANYYCEDLISHITGWQADHAERQANRYCEEAHNIGSLNCTQVSAELKMARALVRLAEIQATLQEQRILFLRQQIKELEDWRSQNSFMSDS